MVFEPVKPHRTAAIGPAVALRAAIYVRVSSPGQEQDGTSLETQEARCRQYATDHGLTVDEAHVYREVFSGAVLHDRPQMSTLRQIARDGRNDVVVSWAVDRLSRNQAHLYIVAEELEDSGVRLEFVTEVVEDSAVGKFLRSAKAFAAEVEREKFRERAMTGKVARVQSGKLMHGKTPLYGYDWSDDSKGRLTVNPVQAGVVVGCSTRRPQESPCEASRAIWARAESPLRGGQRAGTSSLLARSCTTLPTRAKPMPSANDRNASPARIEGAA